MIADDENQNGDDDDTWQQHNYYNSENQNGGEDHTWVEDKATKKAKQNNLSMRSHPNNQHIKFESILLKYLAKSIFWCQCNVCR